MVHTQLGCWNTSPQKSGSWTSFPVESLNLPNLRRMPFMMIYRKNPKRDASYSFDKSYNLHASIGIIQTSMPWVAISDIESFRCKDANLMLWSKSYQGILTTIGQPLSLLYNPKKENTKCQKSPIQPTKPPKPSFNPKKTWHQTFQKLPSSSKTKACGSSNSGNVPKPPTNTSHRLPFKGHHRLMREASQTTIETSSPLDGNKRNAWLEGGFNEFWCVFVFGWLFWIVYMYVYSECWCIMMCTYIINMCWFHNQVIDFNLGLTTMMIFSSTSHLSLARSGLLVRPVVLSHLHNLVHRQPLRRAIRDHLQRSRHPVVSNASRDRCQIPLVRRGWGENTHIVRSWDLYSWNSWQ